MSDEAPDFARVLAQASMALTASSPVHLERVHNAQAIMRPAVDWLVQTGHPAAAEAPDPIPPPEPSAVRTFLGMLSTPARCRSCQREIWWVVTRAGKRMPVTDALVSHFADCPDAASFRTGPANA